MSTPTAEHNIALFVDIENLIRSALEIALPVDLGPIVNKLLEYGRLSVRRGFGDLDAACRGDWQFRMAMRRMIHENLLQFEDIPYMTKFKNSADMRLAGEALSVAYSHPDINYFAIVAADRDYVPVISKLKELGKFIIGVGTSPDTVHEIYVKSCDVFIYYSSLFPKAGAHDAVGQADSSLLEQYLQLLVQATSALAHKGMKAVGGQLVPLMRQLRPDFDLKLVNLDSFRDFVNVAEQQGLITVGSSGGDILIELGPNSAPTVEASRSASTIPIADAAGAKSLYLDFIEEKMKCPLPSRTIRERIYEHTYQTIETRRILGERGNLVDISSEVWRRMGEERSGLTQPMVYKVLYALYRAYTFDAELTDQPYNPNIKACKEPVSDWDRLFMKNCLNVISRERRSWPLMEEPLAELFETTIEEVSRTIDTVL